MDRNEIIRRFNQAATEVLQVSEEKLAMNASLSDDLDADSLTLVELTMACEEAFEISIDESELADLKTVRDVIDLVERKLSAA